MNYHQRYKDFYNSAAWKALRNAKFYEANGLCEKCLKEGKVEKGIEVHHVISIEDDWSKRLDYDNTILLCRDCHNKIHKRMSDYQKFLEVWNDK